MARTERRERHSGWLSVREGARYMRRGLNEFEGMVRTGTIPCYQPDGRRLVNTEDIDAYIRRFPYRAEVPEWAR